MSFGLKSLYMVYNLCTHIFFYCAAEQINTLHSNGKNESVQTNKNYNFENGIQDSLEVATNIARGMLLLCAKLGDVWAKV